MKSNQKIKLLQQARREHMNGEEFQLEIFRKMTPARKLKLAERLRLLNIELLKAGIRKREGNLPPKRMKLRVLQHILPPDLFAKVYGHQ